MSLLTTVLYHLINYSSHASLYKFFSSYLCLMRKWLEVVIHVLFWSCTTWLIASGFSIQSHEIDVKSNHWEKYTNEQLVYQTIVSNNSNSLHIVYYFNLVEEELVCPLQATNWQDARKINRYRFIFMSFN